MKKKLSILLIVIMACVFMFTGCDYKTTVLSNTEGQVAMNGNAVVEKGDYIYFVNGKVNIEDANEFGKVTKGSLARIAKSKLASPSQDDVEIVIPKLFVTGQYDKGVYFYKDYVYFATPSDKKNAAGEVKNTQTEFYKFNLKTGKMDKNPIATSLDNTVDYMFTMKNDVVYLAYTYAEEIDAETSEYFLKVVNTETKSAWTSEAFQDFILPEDNSNTIFYTILSDSKELDEDVTENFYDLYSYTVGDEEAKICLSGAGSYATNRGDRNEAGYPLVSEGGYKGFTITLIKNTGEYLFYSITKLDDNSVIYFGVDYLDNGVMINNFDNDGADNKNKDYTFVKNLGYSDNYIKNAIAKTSIVKSLNEIYYVDTYYGLLKYDYTQTKFNKVEAIQEACKDYTLYYANGNLFYFADASGFYYVVDISSQEVKLFKLNGIAMALTDTFYAPSIINVDTKTYLLGVYTAEYFYNYVYCVDITNAMQEAEAGETLSEYQKALSELETLDREKLQALHATCIGKMTSEDKEAYDAYLEENYPEDEE